MDPDVIIIGIENPSRDVLEQMFQVSKLPSKQVCPPMLSTDCAKNG